MDLNNIDLTDLDLFAEGIPHEAFQALRDEAPVFWNDETDGNRGFWSVTAYDEENEPASDQDRMEIPAFLRRQAN